MITIYSTPSCQYCKMAKSFFKEKGVEYKEIDVSEDDDARQEMFDKSHQMGVPVIEIGEHIFVGFDRPALEEALEENA